MHKMLASLGLALAVMGGAACGGSQKSTTPAEPPPPSPCVPMAAHLAEVFRATLAGEGSPDSVAMADKMVPAVQQVMAERCQADAWTPAAVDCLGKSTVDTIDACEKTLTEAQQESLKTHMQKAIEPLMPQPGSTDEGGGGGGPPVGSPAPDDPCGGGA